MANRLFIEARKAVNTAVNATGSGQYEAMERARNAINSAYANSSTAEKKQLHEMQNELNM